MARKTIKTAYAEVNAAWPAVLPPLTAPEAVRAAKRLYRAFLGQTYQGDVTVTSGARYTRWLHGRMVVNPGDGWKVFIHHLSHAFYWLANPGERPHSKDHARVERQMITEVLKRGWLDGKLREAPRPALTAVEMHERKLAALDIRLQRWETKAKRAATAIKKLHAQRKKLSRRTVV
jgi:hypothetical protein